MKIKIAQLRTLIKEEIQNAMVESFSQEKEDEAREKIIQAVENGLGGFKKRVVLNSREIMDFENALISGGLNPDDFNVDPGHQLPRGKFNYQGQPCTVAIYLDNHAYHFVFDRDLGIKDVDRA